MALVDTATNPSSIKVLAELAAHGVRPTQVDWILLTHIHLDHAGAAGVLARVLPNARVAVHQRGARHMADPSRLMAGTVSVYGEELVRERYGEILPIPPERITEVKEGSLLKLGARTIRVLDTPGHARHHVCYVDETTGHIFTGDTFGLSYRELDNAASDLHRLIDSFVATARSVSGNGQRRNEQLRVALSELLEEEASRQNWGLRGAALWKLLAADIELNAQGLADWIDNHNS